MKKMMRRIDRVGERAEKEKANRSKKMTQLMKCFELQEK